MHVVGAHLNQTKPSILLYDDKDILFDALYAFLSYVVAFALSNQVWHSSSLVGGILWPPFLETGEENTWNEVTRSLSERFCIASYILRDLP